MLSIAAHFAITTFEVTRTIQYCLNIIEFRDENENKQTLFLIKLSRAINYYNELGKIIEQYNELFKHILFLQMGVSLIICCFLSYVPLKTWKTISYESVAFY